MSRELSGLAVSRLTDTHSSDKLFVKFGQRWTIWFADKLV
jgi:hypothetical protein